jgi:hypothetical protein
VTLRRQVVDFVGLYLLDKANQVRRIGHFPVMQEEPQSALMDVSIQVVNAGSIEQGGSSPYSVDDVPLPQEKVRQVTTVLAGDARDKRNPSRRYRRYRGVGPIGYIQRSSLRVRDLVKPEKSLRYRRETGRRIIKIGDTSAGPQLTRTRSGRESSSYAGDQKCSGKWRHGLHPPQFAPPASPASPRR